MVIEAEQLHFAELNEAVRQSQDCKIVLNGVLGHRYIASGSKDKEIEINGVPGNALGAYLNGSTVVVNGNAQDATGDTMNGGRIVINGSSGDATGYAMRGGIILIKGNAGYRAGIHMKAYQDHQPVIVIGGSAGSFLGEYQAGGRLIVLGLGSKELPVGACCGTGMHGGKIYIRSKVKPEWLPPQVMVAVAEPGDLAEIEPYIDDYCQSFGADKEKILSKTFYVLSPNTKNPYKQLYTYN